MTIVVTVATEKRYLTLFEDCLQPIIGPYNAEDVDTEMIGQKLLFLENIEIVHNEKKSGVLFEIYITVINCKESVLFEFPNRYYIVFCNCLEKKNPYSWHQIVLF